MIGIPGLKARRAAGNECRSLSNDTRARGVSRPWAELPESLAREGSLDRPVIPGDTDSIEVKDVDASRLRRVDLCDCMNLPRAGDD